MRTYNGIHSTPVSFIEVWNTTKALLFLKVIAKRLPFWSQHISEGDPPILINKHRKLIKNLKLQTSSTKF